MAQAGRPRGPALLDERAHAKEAGVFRGLARWGTYVIGDTYADANDGCAVPDGRGDRGRAGHLALRHPARHRPGRRPAHRAVAQHRRRRRDHLGHAGRDLERPAGHGRRVRRRGPPRPDVRVELPHGLPRRLPPRPPAGPGGAGRPHDDRPTGAALRPARAGAWWPRATRPTSWSSTRPPSARSRPAWSTTCPGDTPRLFAGSTGVVRVLVNGVETVRDGAPTGAVPGSLLRSGRDTASVRPGRRLSRHGRCRRPATSRRSARHADPAT